MSADQPRSGMPIADAAKHLGVSVEMLRKRAQRGTLPSYKVDGRWFIVVSDQDDAAFVQDATTVQDVLSRTSTPGQDESRAPSFVTPAAFSQLEAIRDQWLKPFVDQLNEKSERIGRLEERLTTTEQERDDLRRQLAEALTAGMSTTGDSDQAPESSHAAQDASGRTEAESLSDESNNGPSKASRSVLGDLWAWVRGR